MTARRRPLSSVQVDPPARVVVDGETAAFAVVPAAAVPEPEEPERLVGLPVSPALAAGAIGSRRQVPSLAGARRPGPAPSPAAPPPCSLRRSTARAAGDWYPPASRPEV